MKLDVSRALKQPGESFPLDAEQAIAPQGIGGETVRFDPVKLRGTYMALEDGRIAVHCTLTATAHARCANCLAPAHADVREPVEELFLLGGDPGDSEIFTYTGQEIDLERLAMSYAVLGLPMRFLCGPDCDRAPEFRDADVDVCLCQKELPGQRPFAALKQLLESAD
jgi:uncharacterized metal-binding protein YceD (DUF177 family)